ncbi:MAG: hydantoinase/oxoprolinase family protein [Acidobacteria bacterium]|nr:hydantoinase/oxoprolinase family protein [Acidobacteriota bacterium]
MRIGVDTGGTFTDCIVADGSGFRVLKVFSSPDDPARHIVRGLRELARSRYIEDVIHGTTVATNNLLERRGVRVALVTTQGFEDLIEIGRQNRPQLYNLNVQRPAPMIARELRFGVRERTAADGTILLRPGKREIERLRQQVRSSNADAVALCFLFSFVNPENERLVAAALRRLGLPVSVSHEILPEFREYERLSTVAINSFLAPAMGRYLTRLEQQVAAQPTLGVGRGGYKGRTCATRLFIMQSSGGITTADRAASEPVRTILSGPAGGVVAARWLADTLGIRRAISFDMGGTSTDVCLLDGPARTTNETTLAGVPVAVPVLDIHSVGAGGGSLARLDAGGALRVGPESAGAVPGPICYGKGGDQPTVTDANLLLGRLDPDHFLGGAFQLSRGAAIQAFERFLREYSRKHASYKDPMQLAQGIVAVSNATMEKALRVISVERGYDPRDFALICFGGGGGLHAAELAASLVLAQVVVPPNPGAFSALGILISDSVRDVSQSVLLAVPPQAANNGSREAKRLAADLNRRFQQLEHAGITELRKDGIPNKRVNIERAIDLRYSGQSYELRVPFTPEFLPQFHKEHERAYGYSAPQRPMEIVSIRVRLTVPTPKPPLQPEPLGRAVATAAIICEKPVWFNGSTHTTRFYDRARLRPGMNLNGPAIVVEYSSTTALPPGFRCRVDEFQNLVITRHAR